MTHSLGSTAIRRFGLSAAILVLIASGISQRWSGALADDEKGAGEVVRGEVVFDDSVPPFRDGTLHVYLEEVTEQDRRAKVVAHLIVNKVSKGQPGGPSPRFAMGEFTPVEGSSYTVRAHVAIGEAPRMYRGDYVNIIKGDCLSLERHSVLERGKGEAVRVGVKPVR